MTLSPCPITRDSAGTLRDSVRRVELFRGWHYTPDTNLRAIRTNGLVPYRLRTEVADAVGRSDGIFVWPRQQQGLGHIGTALSATARHTERLGFLVRNVALLEVAFPADAVAVTEEQLVHDGSLDGFYYHRGEPYLIVHERIPADRITVAEIVPTAAAFGYLLGVSGELMEWQRDRASRGLPIGIARR